MLGLNRIYRPGLIARLFNAGSWKLTLSRKTSGVIRLEDGGDVELPCLGVVAVSSTKALLWHTLEIRSHSRVDRLSGLSGDAAAKLAVDLKRYVNDHLCDLIVSDGDRLREIDDRLHAIVGAKAQYLAPCRSQPSHCQRAGQGGCCPVASDARSGPHRLYAESCTAGVV